MNYKVCDSFVLSSLQIAEVREAAEKHPLELAKKELGSRIAHAMRSACPVDGRIWDKFMTVLVKPGAEIAEHKHKRHAILFYPEACEPVIIGEDTVWPTHGTIIYIPPNTDHTVPRVLRQRLSVAMLVSDK